MCKGGLLLARAPLTRMCGMKLQLLSLSRKMLLWGWVLIAAQQVTHALMQMVWGASRIKQLASGDVNEHHLSREI